MSDTPIPEVPILEVRGLRTLFFTRQGLVRAVDEDNVIRSAQISDRAYDPLLVYLTDNRQF